MTFLPPLTPPVLITHVPDGYDTLLLNQLSQKEEKVVYIARDEERALRLKEQFAFFEPSHPILFFPGWDCLPYDRVSPHPDILAQRLNALTSLVSSPIPYLLITTIQAFLQKIPPREALQGRLWRLKGGQQVDHGMFLDFLSKNGYVRRESVREWGEFAIRGGLLDLFPPGYALPFRLDFFGSTLESLRIFDPLSQVSTGKADHLILKPMGEISLNPETIEHFRKGYRESFGTANSMDPLYLAVSEGRPYAGYEHWLPLFYDSLESLTAYTSGAIYCLDDQLEEARIAHINQIQDHYQTRLEFASLEKQGVPYHPLPPERLYMMNDPVDQLIPSARRVVFTPFSGPDSEVSIIDGEGKIAPSFTGLRTSQENVFETVKNTIASAQKEGNTRILVVGATHGSAERLAHILGEHGLNSLRRVQSFSEFFKETSPALAVFDISRGFQAPGLWVITEEDILGERIGRPLKSKKRSDLFIQEVSSLQLGDFVVHGEHGIGRYEGLETLDVGRFPHDCLKIVYEGGDKLFVPVENIEILSRYGAAETQASLDKLGGVAWQARKARIKKRLKDVADYLLKIAAARKLHHADTLHKPEGTYEEFTARFPYPETDDQLDAIEDVLDDLSAGKPMDRLICGDVGFGKTEVAMRAAFVAASSGKQVALIVPTTLLARQHYQSFTARFKDTGIKVAQLSRLVKPREALQIKEQVQKGDVHILIGTHALLAKSVAFQDLGLLIVDEEQHFGVGQKERLKNIKSDVHVLTLTATPIPRTLQMALSGVREMSLITTPPLDRMAVRTFVLPFDAMVMREAILREQFRGGQTFYVCPRIADLDKVAERLRRFVPEVKFVIAHGQMSPTALENVMSDFYDGNFDVLLSTNIIESGIDIPRANTLLIHRSDLLGLAQLYQLRGRIGRAKVRGYAYLTYPAGHVLTPEAQKRLEVISSLDTLGAGFTLASHDMDIRGTGNLVGEEQSGHIREVGIELYQHMLEEAIAALKAERRGEVHVSSDWTPQISVGLSVLIPENYVADLGLRLSLYKRLSTLSTREEINSFAIELVDRFGILPPEVHNLLEVIYLKSLSRQANVDKVEVGPKGVLIGFHNNIFNNPKLLIDHISQQKGTAKIRPDQKLVYIRNLESPITRLQVIGKILQDLVRMAEVG
ncbi:MAG: transcription-repair coupling factor [Alphaproteobacteria bacterium]|nr:transcription-repair coupling factor [Alphaproteobacteria bacterium]